MTLTDTPTVIVTNQAPLFRLGHIVSTPGADEVVNGAYRLSCLQRHVTGDWGIVTADDKDTNDSVLKTGDRVLSAYPIDPAKPCAGFGDNTFWIITEADRSVTTFLLPSEY